MDLCAPKQKHTQIRRWSLAKHRSTRICRRIRCWLGWHCHENVSCVRMYLWLGTPGSLCVSVRNRVYTTYSFEQIHTAGLIIHDHVCTDDNDLCRVASSTWQWFMSSGFSSASGPDTNWNKANKLPTYFLWVSPPSTIPSYIALFGDEDKTKPYYNSYWVVISVSKFKLLDHV